MVIDWQSISAEHAKCTSDKQATNFDKRARMVKYISIHRCQRFSRAIFHFACDGRYESKLVEKKIVDTNVYASINVYVRYYHFARPRPLAQLFTFGYRNGCGKDGITDIEYTVDIRGGTKNNYHRCSAFQDTSGVRSKHFLMPYNLIKLLLRINCQNSFKAINSWF